MAKITVRPNGSLFVEGDDVLIVDPAGLPIEPPRRPFGLCRCGASEKKPFCDGAHNRIGFQSSCSGSPSPTA